jgi:hypothetical protein
MIARVVTLRNGVFVCALSVGLGLLIPAAGATTVNFTPPVGDAGVSNTYGFVTATAGTLSGGNFTASTSAATLQLFGKADGGDENGLGVTPGVDNEISGNSVIEITFNSATVPGTRMFQMDSVTSPDNWTVLGSTNATSGFAPISGLTNMTDELVNHALPDADNFFLFAIGDSPGASVLLGNIAADLASPVPLPPAIFLFGAALAGLGFLGRRRKEGSALQAL